MYFPNLTLITKRETLGEFQVTYGHTSVRNKYLGETVTAFALTGSLKAPAVVTIDAETVFYGARKIYVSQPLKFSYEPPSVTSPVPRSSVTGRH